MDGAHAHTSQPQRDDRLVQARELQVDQPMRTILVVDDEDSIRRTTRQFLEALGYDVLEASDALEAIGLFGTGRGIDLLISD